MVDFDGALHDLVVANRILANEGVVDAFGHISIRQPDNPDRYIMSCSRSPELVVTDDLMEYTLDGDPFDQRDRPMYAERHIHGAVFEARPDVNAVILDIDVKGAVNVKKLYGDDALTLFVAPPSLAALEPRTRPA